MIVTTGLGPGATLATLGLGPYGVAITIGAEPGVTFLVDPGTFEFLVGSGLFIFLALARVPFEFEVLNMGPKLFRVNEPKVSFRVPEGTHKFLVPPDPKEEKVR